MYFVLFPRLKISGDVRRPSPVRSPRWTHLIVNKELREHEEEAKGVNTWKDQESVRKGSNWNTAHDELVISFSVQDVIKAYHSPDCWSTTSTNWNRGTNRWSFKELPSLSLTASAARDEWSFYTSVFTCSPPPTSYIAGISEHTQPLQYTMGKAGMRGTSWPANKCTHITVCVHPG